MKPFKVATQIIVAALMLICMHTSVAAANRTATVSGNWSNTATWGGGPVPTLADAAFIANGINVTVDGDFQCASLTINNGNQTSYITIPATRSLSVSGATTISSNSSADYKYIRVNGAFSTQTLTMTSGGNTQDAFLEIGTGTVTVSGDVSMTNNNIRAYILFSGVGTCYIGGNLTGGGITSTPGGGTNPTSGTMHFNGSAAQTIPVYGGYWNLTVSNTGAKSIGAATVRNGMVLENGSSLTLTGALTVNNGNNSIYIQDNATLDMQQFDITGNATGTFNMGAGANLYIGNPGTTNATVFPSNYIAANIILDPTSTVHYQANTGQTVSALPVYGNLVLSTAGAKTINGDVQINGGLQINATASFVFGASPRTVSVGGDLTGTGTLNMANNLVHVLNLAGENNSFSGTLTNIVSTLPRINYTRAGDQTVFASPNYRNLAFSGSGTKTLNGTITVNNVLDITGGVLALGNNNLILPATASCGVVNAPTSYVSTDGSGFIQRTAPSIAALAVPYYIGSGGKYSPVTINTLTGSGTPTISLRVSESNMGPNNLGRFWDLQSSLTSETAFDATFEYPDADVYGTEADYLVWFKSSSTEWSNPTGATVDPATNSFTDGTGTVVSGFWTAGKDRPGRTWYSYQTGEWNDPFVWTTDPSGTLYINPANAVPGQYDDVILLNGRIVSITTNAKVIKQLTIRDGGTLNVGNTTGHTFNTIDGQGRYRLATANIDIPASGGTFFQPGGGTVEYNGTGTAPIFVTSSFNNLVINMANAADQVTALIDLTISGNLSVDKGIFRINDNASALEKTITVGGNLTVGQSGQIRTGTGLTGTAAADGHRLILNGDFTVNGAVDFNNGGANYTTRSSSRTEVVFNNPAIDQYLLVNASAIFSRIEIAKGNDWTYTLHIDATDPSYFQLNGRTNIGSLTNSPDIANDNALGLLSGSLRLGSNIVIPCFALDKVHNIDSDAQMIIDGATVTMTSGVNLSALVVYGSLVTKSGTLNINGGQGLVTREQSVLTFEGGVLNTPIIRTSAIPGIHRGAFFMSGGVINIGTSTQVDFHAALSFPYPTNVFNMSGGTINILSPNTAINGAGSDRFSVLLNSEPGNYSVTGGTVNITVPATTDAYINSTVPFWDLNITSASSARSAAIKRYPGNFGPDIPVIEAQDLVVQNNFSINNLAVFSSTVPTPDASIIVGGDFTIQAGAFYVPGTNRTVFNGGRAQTFAPNGTITGNLGDLSIEENTDLQLTVKNITVNGTLSIGSGCTFRDGGYTAFVAGNLVNSGTHFKPVSGAGMIRLTGANPTISGDGAGVFNNLFLNNSATATCDMSLTGMLTLNGNPSRLNIGDNGLLLSSDAAVSFGANAGFSKTCMVQTHGNLSSKGIQRSISATGAHSFPIGVLVGATYYYTPSIIEINSSPATFGSIAISPVKSRHPLAQSGVSLSLYWNTVQTGFSGIVANSVIHKYYYDNQLSNDFVVVPENTYVPGVYRGGVWSFINQTSKLNIATNEIRYDNDNVITGHYTAGEPATFGTVPTVYSVATGNWDDVTTWSTDPVDPAMHPVSAPSAMTAVQIRNGHTVTISVANKNAGSLILESGSILDIGTTTGHNFTMLAGSTLSKGTLRIASSYFPAGDLSQLIGEDGGTIEYYTVASDYVLPQTSAVTGMVLNHYYNLVLAPTAGRIITMPNHTMSIYRNLDVIGAGIARTSVLANTNITVNGDFNVNTGVFEIQNTNARDITVLGLLAVLTGAELRVAATAAVNHNLYLYSNMLNDGTVLLNNTGSVRTVFRGSTNATLSGSGTTAFYSIELDKGVDASSTLTVQQVFTSAFDPAVTFINGTMAFNVAGQSFILSTANSITIPATAGLRVEDGTVTTNSGNNNTSLFLQGALEVAGGILNIGVLANNKHNDIEYSATGSPSLTVTGGGLNVNGSIRRSVEYSAGALLYTQSAGTVTIRGLNQSVDNQVTRAVFEVCNPGSAFIMSGGDLIISRSVAIGTTYGDMYLRPETASVTGGTIFLTGSVRTIDASCPINNLTVLTGTVNLWINDLILTGSLDIRNGATLTCGTAAQYVDVYVGGDFISNGTARFTPFSSKLVFNGITDQILRTFVNIGIYDMIIDKPSGILLLTAGAPVVSHDLIIENGIFDNKNITMTVNGTVTNNAEHRSTTGALIVNSNLASQEILGDGTGIFGNLTLNNTRDVYARSGFTINGTLNFINGNLNIGNNQLVFGSSAPNASNVLEGKCIITNGALSDAGVKKIFAGASGSFIFPIGVAGKYTPAAYTLTYSSPGSVTLKPINRPIQTLTNAFTDELQYYWHVSADDIVVTNATHTYTYKPTDFVGIAENDANVSGARYADYLWTDYGNSVINSVAHTFTLANVPFVSGDYTCGHFSNFLDKPIYYSRSAATDITTTGANWMSLDAWTLDPSHIGAAVTVLPSGNPMVVMAGHVINVFDNYLSAYSLIDSGTVNLGNTIGHNLSTISGNGRLIIENRGTGSFVMPGGGLHGIYKYSQ